MKALSIQQPWAWAILNAGKDIENRSWYTSFRGKFLIHVGKKIDVLGIGILNEDMDITCPTNFMTGGIVGVAEITDCVTKSNNKWYFGRYGFVLKNVASLPFVPYRGQLGFFDIDYKEPRAAQKNTKEDLQTATNTPKA